MSVELLSELLVRRRKVLGISQDDLAILLGISQQAYAKWEAGSSTPRPAHMNKVAEVLEIPIEDAVSAQLAQKQAIQVRISTDSPQGETAEGVGAPVRSKVVKERGMVGLTGFGLVSMLSAALDKQKLEQHQIDTLGALVDSFVLSSASRV